MDGESGWVEGPRGGAPAMTGVAGSEGGVSEREGEEQGEEEEEEEEEEVGGGDSDTEEGEIIL